MASPRFDKPAHRIIELIGWVFVVVGMLGVIFLPQLLLAWVVLVGFGAPSITRTIQRWRARRRAP
jgi:hypothetical protein